MVLYYYFLSFGLHLSSVFLKSLKNLKTLKITTFRMMDLSSFSGKKKKEGRHLNRFLQKGNKSENSYCVF
jgi:hypothetical protein